MPENGMVLLDNLDLYDYNDKGRYGMVQGYTFDGEKVCEMTTEK